MRLSAVQTPGHPHGPFCYILSSSHVLSCVFQERQTSSIRCLDEDCHQVVVSVGSDQTLSALSALSGDYPSEVNGPLEILMCFLGQRLTLEERFLSVSSQSNNLSDLEGLICQIDYLKSALSSFSSALCSLDFARSCTPDMYQGALITGKQLESARVDCLRSRCQMALRAGIESDLGITSNLLDELELNREVVDELRNALKDYQEFHPNVREIQELCFGLALDQEEALSNIALGTASASASASAQMKCEQEAIRRTQALCVNPARRRVEVSRITEMLMHMELKEQSIQEEAVEVEECLEWIFAPVTEQRLDIGRSYADMYRDFRRELRQVRDLRRKLNSENLRGACVQDRSVHLTRSHQLSHMLTLQRGHFEELCLRLAQSSMSNFTEAQKESLIRLGNRICSEYGEALQR